MAAGRWLHLRASDRPRARSGLATAASEVARIGFPFELFIERSAETEVTDSE
eukprot:CAMPEP_0204233066 /NCGR_PEP_ID=MMETSP0361-20130328/89916_1 /ASSEMBLY_ACC=CAM_ASM_000343 /TAXON_ID=268821 /ORGANISM="Scrippsiella Hangoei, Strain SHTV-5" /LENGTH=51 /DNA_ID=CAMNT_0051203315 /DNA_START=60 /DNA_END=212 /DNA_ORIENTATION=+